MRKTICRQMPSGALRRRNLYSMRLAPMAIALLLATSATAAVVGQMRPADEISAARIAALPKSEQAAWTAYLTRSEKLMAADKAALAAERRTATQAPTNPKSGSTSSMPLDRPPEYYASEDARQIADHIVSFQTPAGGWGKNMDRAAAPRTTGQPWVPTENLPAYARSDIEAKDQNWRYVGTIDNGATTTEMRFLARAQAAAPGKEGDAWRASFLKGLTYLLAAQFPNGGWPQVYPLQGGYHDAITYNDSAVSDVADLLQEIATRGGPYAFVPAERAAAAKAADERVTALILKTQLRENGKPSIWGQQHDALTLAPVGARNFEPAAYSTAESVDLVAHLMQQKRTPEIEAAIAGATDWFKRHALHDVEWQRKPVDADGRKLIAKPGAGPFWARFYDFKTGKPIFGDRDRSIHDDVSELSAERRNGYSWFTQSPAKLIASAEKWLATK